MFRRFILILIVLPCVTLNVNIVIAQDLDFAKDLHRHNLSEKAKEMLINIVHDIKSSDAVKAEALYWLGRISFEEGRYTVALDDWEKLIKKYPKSLQAKEVTEHLAQFREIIVKVSDVEISSVIARSYIRNGDFWSNADEKFTIDASWLPMIEMAIEWYDRVIAEFPNSKASEIAYQKKLFTLLGWKEPGQNSSSHGVLADFRKYMPKVLETFAEFEKAFPNSSYLQGFRYQIAQAYWLYGKWGKTRAREWLQKVIDAGKSKRTFYTETAKARLQVVAIQQDLEPSLESVITDLKSQSISTRMSAAETLGEIGDAKAVGPLIDALKDQYAAVRSRAAIALGEIGDKSAIPDLEGVTKEDKDPSVRNAAKEALEKIQIILSY